MPFLSFPFSFLRVLFLFGLNFFLHLLSWLVPLFSLFSSFLSFSFSHVFFFLLIQSGDRGLSALSGRALFAFDPSMFVDDAEAAEAKDFDSQPVDQTNAFEGKYDEEEEQGVYQAPQQVSEGEIGDGMEEGMHRTEVEHQGDKE